MNREEVICMAREAGLFSGATEMVFSASLERFAALVAAAEREACAKVCEAMNAKCDVAGPAVFAKAIRSRGEVKP